MKVYIVTGNLQVRPEQEAAFLKETEGRIIASGNSIQNVLIKYNKHLNDQYQ